MSFSRLFWILGKPGTYFQFYHNKEVITRSPPYLYGCVVPHTRQGAAFFPALRGSKIRAPSRITLDMTDSLSEFKSSSYE
jgi:hypothetical protein